MYLFFAGFIGLREFGSTPLHWCCREATHCLYLRELPDFWARPWATRVASALGEVTVSLGGVSQCEVQDTLWEHRSLWGLEKPTHRPTLYCKAALQPPAAFY